MTQEQIAKQIGIAASDLSSYLSGRFAVGPRRAQKIAAYLGDPDWRRYVHIPGPELRRLLAGQH